MQRLNRQAVRQPKRASGGDSENVFLTDCLSFICISEYTGLRCNNFLYNLICKSDRRFQSLRSNLIIILNNLSRPEIQKDFNSS